MGSLVRLDGRLFWRSSMLHGLRNVIHGVSTRGQGVSRRPFDSLNVGLHVGDLREDVLCNRAIVLKSFGISPADVVCGEQVHGTQVHEATRADMGRGAFHYEDAIPGVDALITSAQGVALMGYFADCTPVFFAHPGKGWIGLAHAGWRGTLNGIVTNVVDELQRRGVPPGELYVAMGPRIGPCCYEVSDDLADSFRKRWDEGVVHPSKSHRRTVDLAMANFFLLQEQGVKKDHIEIASDCTACLSHRYFSHRGSGSATGRMAGVIALSR